MPIDYDAVIEFVKDLRLRDIQHLVQRFEDELGVQAAVVAPPQRVDPPVQPVPPTSFDVVLTDVGDQRLPVIRALRATLGVPLREARQLADTLPAVLATDVDEARGNALAEDLQAAGAGVEIRPHAP